MGNYFTIKGNNGANTLNGTAFYDWIYGYGGDDKLYGHGGKDTILDFQDGVDIINLADVSGIPNFSKLKQHVVQIADDVLIDLGNGNSITIENIDKSALSANDFIF